MSAHLAQLGTLFAGLCAALAPGALAAPPIQAAAGPDGFPRLPVAEGALAAPAAQHQEFVWDFTECRRLGLASEGTDMVNADRWDLPGGCHLRFLDPGQSWLQATFALAGDPRSREAQAGNWSLGIYHLAVQPDGPVGGLAPVRVTLNDQVVWDGRIAQGRSGPGNIWNLTEIDVASALRRGTNTLRFDFVGDGATHYWLKAFAVVWDPS
jgi:hypothetical protein